MRKCLFTSLMLLPACILLCGSPASAYLYDMSKAKFGSYLRGSLSSWSQGQTPWSESSGSGVAWDNQYSLMPSYEFGFLYSTPRVTWRLGFEFIEPSALNNVNGSGSSNQTPYYTVSNNLSDINAKLGVEINLKRWQNSRLWLLAEGGPAFLTMQNTFNFTSAGSAQFNGLTNFQEQIQGQTIMYAGGLGFETYLSDTTTIAFEAGYRECYFSSLTHNEGATTFQGQVSQGTQALQNSGSARTLDLSTFYAAVDLRVWFF